MKRVCTRLITMNQAIRRRFVGPDVDGRDVSGLILHVAKYDKQQQPISYRIQLDAGGTTLVSASVIAEHLSGLALLASIEHDNE